MANAVPLFFMKIMKKLKKIKILLTFCLFYVKLSLNCSFTIDIN